MWAITTMIILYSNQALLHYCSNNPNTLAFVPTMGALHQGHLSLVRAAKQKNYRVLVSIFVNPLQFNNLNDLLKYPKTILKDLQLLSQEGVDAVYLPSQDDVYPPNNQSNDITLFQNNIEHVFEGHFRPGHFNGVVQVLHRFFSLIQPHAVFFGQKDLQQCMIVKLILDQYFPTIEFHIVPTMREQSGLAMSSRNVRLSHDELEKAKEIYISLKNLSKFDPSQISIEIKRLESLNITTEYLSYINLPNFDVPTISNTNQAVIFAGYLGQVRLIDNLLL